MSNPQVLHELKSQWRWQDAEWIPLARPLTFEFYEQWINEGHHGEMDYLKRHLPLKAQPHQLLAEALSIIMVTKSYVPHFKAHERLSSLRTAAYAQNEDYHDVFGAELKAAALQLSKIFPDALFRAGTDSLPVMERDHAAQAGLGWIGKNTCLIHPKNGSFTLIGEILSTLPMQRQIAPLPDFCGTCRRCIDICPTQALATPRHLDARRCISYWTIESKTTPPLELAERFGDWFFGCDLCQAVCPWNQKPFRGSPVLHTDTRMTPAQPERLIDDLSWCLKSTETQMRSLLRSTPLIRAKAFGLRRNAMIVAANRRIQELIPAISLWREDERLGELARWALQRIQERDRS